MTRSLPLALALALSASLTLTAASAQDAKGFRVLPIPAREHGYSNFKSQVIGSQRELDDFLKASGDMGWNDREGFVKALQDAKIDFTKEALVLVRRTEGSGSIKVSFATPELKDGKLVCTIERVVPQVGTDDIAEHGFAVAVSRGRVRQVEVWIDKAGQGKAQVFPVKEN